MTVHLLSEILGTASIKAASWYIRTEPRQLPGTIFPKDLSDARLMERRGLEARPHGFRSTLRVWLTESQQASREVAETIIAHQTGSLTERAYNRTDFLEQRRELMEA